MNETTAYTVSYHSENHWGVMTQTWGSITPKVNCVSFEITGKKLSIT